jgi:uncharacterized protein
MPPPLMPIVTAVAPYTNGPAGVHGVLAQARTGLGELALLHGLDPKPVTEVSTLSPADIDGAGVLALFTIGETPFTTAQRDAIAAGWRAGRLRVLGVHSASDACHTWPEYGAIVGARFDGHPWTQDFDITVVEPRHPATAHLDSPWHWHDELYLFRELRGDARVLLRTNPTGLDLSVPGAPARLADKGLPLCWCHTEGPARSFYTALGHFAGAWENPVYLRHLSGALDWLLGE